MGKKDKKVKAEAEEVEVEVEVPVEKKSKKSKTMEVDEPVPKKEKKDKKDKKDKKRKAEESEEEVVEEAPKESKKEKKAKKAKVEVEEEEEELVVKKSAAVAAPAPASKLEPSSQLFLGNCPDSMDDSKVYEIFDFIGTKGVTSINWVMKGGKFKNAGFVTFSSVDVAKKALEGVGVKTVDGSTLRIDYAKAQPAAQGAPASGGGGKDSEENDRTMFMGNCAEKNDKAIRSHFKSVAEDAIEDIRWGERDGEFKRFGFVICKDVETMQACLKLPAPSIKGQQVRLRAANEPKGNYGAGGAGAAPGATSDRAGGSCFKCGDAGHRKSECQFERPCFNCGKPGHMKADCTAEPNREARTIFVSGCPDDIDDSDITECFGKMVVNRIRWLEKDGVFKGCGFIEICDEDRCKRILERVPFNIKGSDLRMVLATPRDSDAARAGGKGGAPAAKKAPPASQKKAFDDAEDSE